ncbi:MAG: uroporphyrinogen decarboxylase [Chloroflexi bacterium]|nr:uroporphyrinogen decarboxylase [Chloroflexota bacterium]
MTTPWNRFKQAARREAPDQVPVALIVDSPWLPGYANIDTLDYYLFPEKWLEINLGLLERFPEVVWIPGFWVEYGMAAEPSAFGARVHFHHDGPPSIEPVVTDVTHWADAPLPDVQEDGFMPLALRLYEEMEARLQAEGLGIRMVAARGPFVTAGWVMGITDLMMGIVMQPAAVNRFLDTVTTTIIRWLHAQLDTLREPEGILLLDDIVGMVSLKHYQEFVAPRLQRIFDEFDGLVRIYHNDTPCAHLYGALAEAHFDVFNFTHEADIAEVKAAMGHNVALMGNVAPLDLGVRGTPDEVEAAARVCLDKAAPGGGMILSFGGGISPGTKPENIDALLQAAQAWHYPSSAA